jgi:hypothetical protein
MPGSDDLTWRKNMKKDLSPYLKAVQAAHDHWIELGFRCQACGHEVLETFAPPIALTGEIWVVYCPCQQLQFRRDPEMKEEHWNQLTKRS